MVLLPIVQLALGANTAPRGTDEVVGVIAEEVSGRIEIRVECTGRWARDRESQALPLRATMALLFGDQGRLEFSTVDTRTIVWVSWPVNAPVADYSLHPQPA
jgi:hypothetical protein